jgi:hypothetical protein
MFGISILFLHILPNGQMTHRGSQCLKVPVLLRGRTSYLEGMAYEDACAHNGQDFPPHGGPVLGSSI